MTPSTGKRSYRACLRCRRRKIRCDFDGIGELKKVPCVSCHLSGSECILADSRRGGSFRRKLSRSSTGTLTTSAQSLMKTRTTENTTNASSDAPWLDQSPFDDRDRSAEQGSRDVLAMELRNPSDALQILVRSGETTTSSQSPAQTSSIQNSDINSNLPTQDESVSTMRVDRALFGIETTPTLFKDYELVQRCLLRPSLVSELVFIFHKKYHLYFPIVPCRFFKAGTIGRLEKPDYFLLTAILTIASRDDPQQSLTHRYCWDHTQRLLIDVLLAHPWTQTTHTVEGLLLLAEWLPHIQVQEATPESPKSLLSDDRTAWSLVGLAVRQGYLQRLDQGAFRNADSSESKDQSEQNRLIWAYIFMADRQISVRLGQSFWSRGPSLNANFTAKDFPSLRPVSGNGSEDFASMTQASLELTQILHNVHAVLYSSKDRTLAMVLEGNYARYLDDFRTSANTWHSTWSSIALSANIKTTLMIMYEYICLYTNAFSLQAVFTRASMSHATNKMSINKGIFTDLFAGGLMLSPDGIYIFNAISAATKLLMLINSLDPRQVICYLPSRYYLYGIYAAVLLHQADIAGAFERVDQQQEVIALARKFIDVLRKAPSTDSHICHNYARMLNQLWDRRERNIPQSARHANEATTNEEILDTPKTNCGSHTAQNDARHEGDNMKNMSPFFSNSPTANSGSYGVPSIENYFLGSFMPGLADFSTVAFDADLGQEYQTTGEFQNWTEPGQLLG